jgi:hypothetical protein
MKKRVWIVTTDGTRDPTALTKDLASAGLTITQAFSHIPSVTGLAEGAAVPKIKQVKGVIDVVPETAVDVGPPGGTETW